MTMKMISLLLPPIYLQMVDDLVREGKYNNRSEAIRIAIRDMLVKHDKFYRYPNEQLEMIPKTLREGQGRGEKQDVP